MATCRGFSFDLSFYSSFGILAAAAEKQVDQRFLPDACTIRINVQMTKGTLFKYMCLSHSIPTIFVFVGTIPELSHS